MQANTSLEITNSQSQAEATTQETGHSQEEKKMTWWQKTLDMEEAKTQMLFAMPLILTNLFYHFIPMVSVMIAGHLGDLELASATLANSWATVSGFAVMIGLSGALETLCGQGFGAKLYPMLGLYLQASCLISVAFSIIISILWLLTETILVTLHQDPEISKAASVYIKYLIPGIFAYGFLQDIMRFLQAQATVKPLVLFSLVPLLLNVGISYALVHWTTLGAKGASLAASVTLWIAVLMLAVYVYLSKRFEATWNGFSHHSFYSVPILLRLAVPSAVMVVLEYFAFEILVLLAGLMPDSKRSTSIIAICVNTEAIAYVIVYGLSAAASTRVSNELGAGNPKLAKNAMSVALKLSIVLALIVVGALACGQNVWIGFFTSTPSILKAFASLVPFLVVSITLDSIQGVLSGVARGCGWQYLVVYINFGAFYFVGVTSAALFAFKLKLHAKGLWIGLICGLFCQVASLLVLTLSKNWKKLDILDERRRTS